MSTTTPTSHATAAATITAPELRSRLHDVRILDVRTAGEFAAGHVPGSYHVPLDTLGEHCDDLCGADADVVVVCQSGGRAAQAAVRLAAAGMAGVRVLDGGMGAWTAAGGDVATTTGATWSLERQVRLVAGGIVLAAVVGSVVVPGAKWLAGGVGAGLTFAAVSNTCAMGNLLARLPHNRTPGGDVAAAVSALVADRPSPSAA